MCSGVKITLVSRRNHNAMSSNPNPTTTRPITAPLLRAIFKPLFKDFEAPHAVLFDAYVAVFIPR